MCVDPAAGEIVWFWFDNYGHPRSSFALDGRTLAFHVESRAHGQDTLTPVFSGRYERH